MLVGKLVVAAAFAALAIGQASAAPVNYSGYDINDAVTSGHGSWAHTYSGTITPTGNFVNNGFPGTRADYSGVGSGTLNDGIIGTSTSDSQLFVAAPGATDGTTFDPSIILTLPAAYFIDQIDIFGGGPTSNGIPGLIEGVTVSLLDTSFVIHTETFATTPFGAVNPGNNHQFNDRISLVGSTLENIAAYAIFLDDFTGDFSSFGGWFSITEIEVDGQLAPSPVPLPAAAWLFLTGLGGAGALRLRSRRRPAAHHI